MINEMNEQQLKDNLAGSASAVIFIYTPLCGTCHLARRMLEIVLELLPGLKLVSSNIHSIPYLSETWQIESVPCLLIIENGVIKRKVYAMRSVDYLYSLLNHAAFQFTTEDDNIGE